MSSETCSPAPALLRLSDQYEGMSNAVRDTANRLPATASPLVRAALIHAADVLSTLDLGFYEVARTGSIAPLEDLAGRANSWLAEVVGDWAADIAIPDAAHAATDPDDATNIDPLIVLADDGNPHNPDED